MLCTRPRCEHLEMKAEMLLLSHILMPNPDIFSQQPKEINWPHRSSISRGKRKQFKGLNSN